MREMRLSGSEKSSIFELVPAWVAAVGYCNAGNQTRGRASVAWNNYKPTTPLSCQYSSVPGAKPQMLGVFCLFFPQIYATVPDIACTGTGFDVNGTNMALPVEVASALGAMSITPSDTAVFVRRVSHVYVGTTGNLRVMSGDGNDVTLVAVLAGTLLPLTISRVFATGTTAQNIVGLMP